MLSHVWRASLGSSLALWRSMSEEFMENGASSHSEDSDNNQSRWKNLLHGCSGGFGLWFQVWDEVMRHAAAQRSGSGGWNAYVQHRSTALAVQDPACTPDWDRRSHLASFGTKFFAHYKKKGFYTPTRKFLLQELTRLRFCLSFSMNHFTVVNSLSAAGQDKRKYSRKQG